jgi:hypothetical protein
MLLHKKSAHDKFRGRFGDEKFSSAVGSAGSCSFYWPAGGVSAGV